MAIATSLPVQFKCGHSETKDFSSTPPGKRKAKAFGLGKNFVCSRCFRASRREDLERQNQEQLIHAQGFDEEHGLPELTGSDKQIRFATRIRYRVLSDIITTAENHRQSFEPEQVVDAAKSLVRAGWWLDNTTEKDLDVDDLINLITTAIDEDDLVGTENPF